MVRSATQFARNRGVSIQRYPPRGSLEHNLKQIINLLEINCVIDVGAYLGEFASKMRSQVEYRGRIVSIEPVTQAFTQLEAKMRDDPDWRGIRMALGDAPATAELSIMGTDTNTNFSSFHSLNVLARRRFGNLSESGRETVIIQRLDDVLDGFLDGLEKPRIFLKIDTQGHDLAVIQGAGGRIAEISAILLEAPTLPIYEDVPNLDKLLVEMRAREFDPCEFFPVSRTTDRLRTIEFDCTFVNRSMLKSA
jgi:FkbM family methyltransferase